MSSPIDLRSQIRAVTIYRRGAMVTRAVELVREGAAFPTRIQLVGLPLTLDDSSVSVELEAEPGRPAPIAGDLRVSVSTPSHDPELPPPTNEELERARLELVLARQTQDQHTRAKARLGALKPVARGRPEEGKPPGPSPTAARLELLDFRRERAEQLTKHIHAADERVREATEQLETLRERERVASSQRNARTYELRKAAILELDQTSGAKLVERVRVRLRYFVPGARWAPAYTVRLDAAMRAATLELRAMVGQSTGEDWHNVALTLSTASPQQWTELPELESRRIGRRQPPPAKTGWRPPPVGADGLYADFDRALGGPVAEPEPEPEPASGARDQPVATSASDDDAWQDLVNNQMGPPVSGSAPPPGGMPMPQASPAPARHAVPAAAPQAPPSFGPPAGMPPPAPLMMPETFRSQSKRSGLGALVGGAIDGIASSFSAGDTQTLTFGGGGGGMIAPEPEPELVAGRELLDYGRLRLSFASSLRRGALHRIGMRAQYRQLSAETVRVDLAIEQIREALEWARLLDTEPAPEGHRWPSSEGGFDYAYVADAPVDLASTSAFHSLPIDVREAEATPRYVSVPRESQDVFRIVSLRNPLAAPLLPGPADVYVGGKFALTSAVELTPIDGRIELGLGVEQAIKIARNVTFAEDSSGMFKRHIGLTHTLALEVHNHLGSPARVEIRERLPIAAEAQADEIEIEIEAVTPSWDDYEPKDPDHPLEGGRLWQIDVPANGKRELSATWVVTIPTSHELVGGNRRES